MDSESLHLLLQQKRTLMLIHEADHSTSKYKPISSMEETIKQVRHSIIISRVTTLLAI